MKKLYSVNQGIDIYSTQPFALLRWHIPTQGFLLLTRSIVSPFWSDTAPSPASFLGTARVISDSVRVILTGAVDIEALNKPSRSFNLHNHGEGPFLFESSYYRSIGYLT